MEVTAEEESKKTQERQREMQRRMNPTTVQDFEVKADGSFLKTWGTKGECMYLMCTRVY